jgi:hypothetical protein
MPSARMTAGLEVTERACLAKFDGDVTPEQIDASEVTPVEVLVFEKGVQVDHWTPDQNRPWPRS